MQAPDGRKATFSSPTAAQVAVVGLRSCGLGFGVGFGLGLRLGFGLGLGRRFGQALARGAAVLPRVELDTPFYTVVVTPLVPYTGAPARNSVAPLDERDSQAGSLPSPMTPRFSHSAQVGQQVCQPGRLASLGAAGRGAGGVFAKRCCFSNRSNALSVRDAFAGDSQPPTAEGRCRENRM